MKFIYAQARLCMGKLAQLMILSGVLLFVNFRLGIETISDGMTLLSRIGFNKDVLEHLCTYLCKKCAPVRLVKRYKLRC